MNCVSINIGVGGIADVGDDVEDEEEEDGDDNDDDLIYDLVVVMGVDPEVINGEVNISFAKY